MLFLRLGIFIFLIAFGVSSISASAPPPIVCSEYPCTNDPDCPGECKCDAAKRYCVPVQAGENDVYNSLPVQVAGCR
ncbi:hypothetical protein BGY98DRAFT_460293 [Russula aff. rugulosa BPL654]|nr:hypothetical protein BGY98DRAFT_460293 [Russula aff. rugulosa BPL654]